MADEPRVQTFCEHLQSLLAKAKEPRELSENDKKKWRLYFEKHRAFIQTCCLMHARNGKHRIEFVWYINSRVLMCDDLRPSVTMGITLSAFQKICNIKTIQACVIDEFRRILGPGVVLSMTTEKKFVFVNVEVPVQNATPKEKTMWERFDDIEQAIALLPPNGGGSEYRAAATRFAEASGSNAEVPAVDDEPNKRARFE